MPGGLLAVDDVLLLHRDDFSVGVEKGVTHGSEQHPPGPSVLDDGLRELASPLVRPADEEGPPLFQPAAGQHPATVLERREEVAVTGMAVLAER